MVSVLVCILPSLVSVESMSWRQFLPLPHSLLVLYLTHPLARQTLEILFIALSGFSSAGPIRSISAPFEGRITNISPLQPQTPHVQWHQWIPLMCQDEYVCKCCFFFLFYQFMCFSHLLCLATATAQFATLLFLVENVGEIVFETFWPEVYISNAPEFTPKCRVFLLRNTFEMCYWPCVFNNLAKKNIPVAELNIKELQKTANL